MEKKRVLVTGSSGFIGSHLAHFFSTQGYEVYGCSRHGQSMELWRTVTLDLLDLAAVVNVLQEIRPDIILHCAGVADVGRSVRQPDFDFAHNVRATHNVFFALHQLQATGIRVVFMSTAAVYGNPQTLPIKEEMPFNPLSPYALHKVMCEEICQYFAHNYQLDVKIARIFSAYGEGLRKQIFWDMHQKIQRTGRLDMLGSGQESRDYIYIDDLVRAIYLLATRDCAYNIYNVANGEETTIAQAVESFAVVCGLSRDKIRFTGQVQEGNPRNWCADISRLRELGYQRQVSYVDGLRRYRDWLVQA